MWEIYTNGGGDFFRLVFNGIAQIFRSDDFFGALRLAALFGVIAFLVSVAFMRGKFNINWLLSIIIVLMVVVVPKVDLVITDRVVPSESAVVSNVPFGIAATASVFSMFSDYITRAFETVFSLPNEVQYSGNGLLFAQSIVEQSTRFNITNSRVSTNFTEFWKSCVYYDLSLDLYTWSDLTAESDLMGFFRSNTSQARSFTYEQPGGGRIILGCRDGINNQMTTDLTNEIENATNIYGVRMVPNADTQTDAVAKFAATMPVAYQFLTGMSRSNSDLLGQNMLANSLRRGLSSFASDADASAAAQDFAAARAERERMTTFAVMGRLAKKMLPILHLLFEAFIYCVFPIVVVMLMLPVAGKVAMGYAKALFWVSLWPPLYAVLHFAMSYFGQKSASAAVVQEGGGFPTGLTISTNTALGETLADYSTMAGYLSLSIPMIAWMMVSQSGAMLAGMAGRLMQSYDNPVSKASDEATAGNVNLGNTKYETESAFQANASPSDLRGGMTTGDGAGNALRIDGDGRVFTDTTSSTSPFSMDYGSKVQSTASANYSQAVEAEQSAANRVVESNAALRAEAVEYAQSEQSGTSGSTSFSSGRGSSDSDTFQSTSQVMEDMAMKNGFSVENVQAIQAEVYAQAEAGGNLGFASVKGGVRASQSIGAKDISREEYNAVISTMASEQYTNALREDVTASTSGDASVSMGMSEQNSERLGALLNEQTQSSQDYTTAQKERETAQQQVQYAEQVGASVNAKGNDGFYSWLSESEGLSTEQIRGMVADANSGDATSRNILGAYAQEYVSTELAEYSSNQATPSRLSEGNMPEFNAVQDQVASRGEAGRAENQNYGEQRVRERGEATTQEVGSANTVPDRETVQEGVNKYIMNALVTMNQNDVGSMSPSPDKASEVRSTVDRATR